MKNLVHDFKDIPSWIWLGGAAALAFLFVLHRNAAPPQTTAGALKITPTSSSNTTPDVPTYTSLPQTRQGENEQINELSRQVERLSTQWNSSNSYMPNGKIDGSYYGTALSADARPAGYGTSAPGDSNLTGTVANGMYTPPGGTPVPLDPAKNGPR